MKAGALQRLIFVSCADVTDKSGELSELLLASDTELLFSDAQHWATVQQLLAIHPVPVVLLDRGIAPHNYK